MSAASIQKISFVRLVGSPFCVSIEDGNKVHNAIATAIERGDQVQISFSGVTRLTTAFLNAAIGQLYDNVGEARVSEKLLPPIDASQEQLRLLVKVVENARRFFAEPDRHREMLDDNE